MIRNYLLISVRNLLKHLSYSLLNISGLALGLATCLLLVTWLRHELSFDRFHENASRIYRGSMEYSFGGQVAKPSVSPTALLPALLALPETETGVRLYNPSLFSEFLVSYENRLFQEDRFYVADSTFFKVFSFHLVQGKAEDALTEPYSLVLTERMAEKYFGNDDPMGKVLTVNNHQNYKVTAIVENPPTNSLLQFDFIASFNSMPAGRSEPVWWSANYQTFVLLHPNADLQSMTQKINDVVMKVIAQELSGEGDYVRYNFMPLADIYLRSGLEESERVSDIKYIYIFTGVTILIMIIACINYINLATARAGGRAKEVGIRKVSGALRNQLFYQFIGESIFITAISFALAIFVAVLSLPLFNQLTGRAFSYHILFDPSFLAITVGGLVVVSFIAGAYPALALTSFSPVQVLKGNFRNSQRGTFLRKSLVVFQFSISVILIAATLIIMKQLDFIREKNLGYDRENTIMLPLDGETGKVFESLKSELKRTGAALYVGRGSESPSKVLAGYSMNTTEKDGPGIVITGLLTDEEFIPALGMELVAGRNFTKADVERLENENVLTFILNEAAINALYINREQAIGTKVKMFGRPGEIIGVIRNFHYASLHNLIGPLVIFPENQFQKIFVKLPPGDTQKRIDDIARVWNNLVTHRPFEFTFLDQQYASLYQGEERMGSLATVFSTLAIIIACLGLFGLVAFSAEQRKKEIGIRKVLGAPASRILLLITGDFARLVITAVIIGLPIAYWLMSGFWLSEFAYKTEPGLAPFVLAAAACLIIAVGTTGYQVLKASWIDPAETLRNE
jgi:putative ABC transport system permease protein